MKKQKALFLLTLMLSAICMRIGATSLPAFAAAAKAQLGLELDKKKRNQLKSKKEE